MEFRKIICQNPEMASSISEKTSSKEVPVKIYDIFFFLEIPIRAPGVNAEGNLEEIAEGTMGRTLEDTSRGILFRKKNNERISERAPERSRQDILMNFSSTFLGFLQNYHPRSTRSSFWDVSKSSLWDGKVLPGLSSEIPSLISSRIPFGILPGFSSKFFPRVFFRDFCRILSGIPPGKPSLEFVQGLSDFVLTFIQDLFRYSFTSSFRDTFRISVRDSFPSSNPSDISLGRLHVISADFCRCCWFSFGSSSGIL